MSVAQQVDAWDELLDFLLTAPTPQQIVEYRASGILQERARYLLDRNRSGHLTEEEQNEIEELSRSNHFVIMLKARAHQRLQKADQEIVEQK